MKAFKSYHPTAPDEDYEMFKKLRDLNYSQIRKLYLQQILNEEDYFDMGSLIHKCNIEELRYAKAHLNKVRMEGARVILLSRNISEKTSVPYQKKKTLVQEINEETLRKAFWVNKGKRFLARRVKNGLLGRLERDKICRCTSRFKTILEAQDWCEKIIDQYDPND